MSIYGKIQNLENKIEAIEEVAYARNVVIFGARTDYTEITGTYILASTALTASKANITSELTASRANITNELTASKVYLSNHLEFASGYGINFSATSDTSGKTSEILNDYEEGTWTPIYISSGGGTATYSAGVKGFYTKIGRTVFINAFLATNSITSLNGGNISISGLPYTKTSDTSYLPTFTSYLQDFNTALIDIKADIVLSSPTTIVLYAVSASSNAFEYLKTSNMTAGTNKNLLEISGFYITD
jgi:hypothetical protein